VRGDTALPRERYAIVRAGVRIYGKESVDTINQEAVSENVQAVARDFHAKSIATVQVQLVVVALAPDVRHAQARSWYAPLWIAALDVKRGEGCPDPLRFPDASGPAARSAGDVIAAGVARAVVVHRAHHVAAVTRTLEAAPQSANSAKLPVAIEW